MEEKLDITKFDPTVSELQTMIALTSGITADDLESKEQLQVVKEARIGLKNARVQIQKKGKELREDAIAFQKTVISKEKELIAIIEPEEERLAEIEEQAKQIQVKKDRLKQMPYRLEKLASISDGYVASPEYTDREAFNEVLLGMDEVQFEEYYNRCVAQHNESVRLENERIQKERDDDIKRREQAIQDEENRQKREQEIKDAEERGRIEAQEKLERDKRERDEKAQRDEQERLDSIKKEEQENHNREDYNAFLASHGYTPETAGSFKIEKTSDGMVLYKKLGIFVK